MHDVALQPHPTRRRPALRPSHDSVTTLYDSVFVNRYDMSAALWEWVFCRKALHAFDGRLRRLPQRPLRVLDLGCGTGRNLHRLERAGVAVSHYTGVDRSARMLRRADRNHSQRRLDFVVGDAVDVALNSSGYDLVLATWILSHQPEPELLLHAARSALAPEGRLLVLAITDTERIAGRVHSWRFRRRLHATPIEPELLAGTSPAQLVVGGSGLTSYADVDPLRTEPAPFDEGPTCCRAGR